MDKGRLYVAGFAKVNELPAAGAVYVFDATTGMLERTLSSPNPERGGLFGSTLEVSNHHIIVGAQFETVNGIRFAGRVYIFDASTGSLVRTIIDPVAQTGPYGSTFGSSIGSSNGRLFIGAASETGQMSLGAIFIISGIAGSAQQDDAGLN